MQIRPEEEKDYFNVEKMVRDSFWNIYRPGAYEHYIVHNLRKDPSFVKKMAYVIEKDGEIIGHINYSYGKICREGKKPEKALVLGPVSIHTNYQNMGYGSELIEYTLNLTDDENIPFVFVIGDENYYKRFGFESASKYGLFLEGTDKNDECPFFQIKTFKDCELEGGTFANPNVFDVNESDVEEFDKKFEYKQKKVLEGQL